jgi:hypothetical protein
MVFKKSGLLSVDEAMSLFVISCALPALCQARKLSVGLSI